MQKNSTDSRAGGAVSNKFSFAAAKRESTYRLGGKAVLATPAAAIRQWATDLGTLGRNHGGTGIAPANRLSDLCADEAANLPVSALACPELRNAFRVRRQNHNDEAVLAQVEWTAMAVAVEDYLRLNLPHNDNPFASLDAAGYIVLTQIQFTAALRTLAKLEKATDPIASVIRQALSGTPLIATPAALNAAIAFGRLLKIKGEMHLASLAMSAWAARFREGEHYDEVLAQATRAASPSATVITLRAA